MKVSVLQLGSLNFARFSACLGAPISVCDVCDSRVMCPGCIPALPDDCWDILQLPTIIRKKLPVEN